MEKEMIDIVNVINLPKRTDRMSKFEVQASEQNMPFKRWDGIIDLACVFRGISAAHRRIIMYAKTKGLSKCFVAEDDCLFTGLGAWDYFISQMPKEADMYFASFYEGKVDGNNRLIKGNSHDELLSGMTLYVVYERFYDVFLNVNPMDHIDKSLGLLADKYEFYVCNPFVAIQSNGYSDNKKKECNYDKYMIGRKLFGGNSHV